MNNQLLDVSIKTMIGMLPEIVNENNRSIDREFESIRTGGKMVLDVSSDQVTAQTVRAKNLTVDGISLNSMTLEEYSNISKRLDSLDSSVAALSGGGTVFGAARRKSPARLGAPAPESAASAPVRDGTDMTRFFSISKSGRLDGASVADLPSLRPYRTLGGVAIPLQICSLGRKSGVRAALYHDHVEIGADGSVTLSRVYVPVRDANDGSGIVQDDSAATVALYRSSGK